MNVKVLLTLSSQFIQSVFTNNNIKKVGNIINIIPWNKLKKTEKEEPESDHKKCVETEESLRKKNDELLKLCSNLYKIAIIEMVVLICTIIFFLLWNRTPIESSYNKLICQIPYREDL